MAQVRAAGVLMKYQSGMATLEYLLVRSLGPWVGEVAMDADQLE